MADEATRARWRRNRRVSYANNRERILLKQKEYYARNRERCKEVNRLWRAANMTPELNRERQLKHRYGISVAEYNRLFEKQGGKCALCNNVNGHMFHRTRLQVDHCHETGRVRGLLCTGCNRGLHILEDGGLKKIRKILKYLGVKL